MSRRRKRKKNKETHEGQQPSSPSDSHVDSPVEKASEPTRETLLEPTNKKLEPIPVRRMDEPSLSKDDELHDLGDDFEDESPSQSDTSISLPSGENKKELRTIRRAEQTAASKDHKSEDELAESPRKHRLRKTSEIATSQKDELGSLDELQDESPSSAVDDLPKAPLPEPKPESEPELQSDSEPVAVADISPDSPPSKDSPPNSAKDWVKSRLTSLSLVEQASLGILITILLVAGIWSTNVVSARIPNTVIASKLKFPLKGESVVIADLESYWRSPIREGKEVDEGVSESIAIIPEIKVTLHPDSEAKALRFLFRDEEGRYVGDSSTVLISGANFAPAEDVTATTKGKVAIIRSTTGFQHEGELISYLADENFQWEVVILESKDGEKYTEFMAIPISANRNDKS